MATETLQIKVMMPRWCNYCFADWKELCGREELRKILEKVAISECPNCHMMT